MMMFPTLNHKCRDPRANGEETCVLTRSRILYQMRESYRGGVEAIALKANALLPRRTEQEMMSWDRSLLESAQGLPVA
jgi:hypothetical protein